MSSALVYLSGCEDEDTKKFTVNGAHVVNLRNFSQQFWRVSDRGTTFNDLGCVLGNALRGYKFIFSHGEKTIHLLSEILFLTERPILNLHDFGCKLNSTESLKEIEDWCEENYFKINLLEATVREKTFKQYPFQKNTASFAENGFIYVKSKFENQHLLSCVFCNQLMNVCNNDLPSNMHKNCLSTCLLYPNHFYGYDFNY
jgi:hypothetical protein